MIELRHNTETKRVTGWCKDESQFGNFKLREGEEIIILDIPIPDKPMEALLYDEATQTLIDNPDYVEPITRNPLAEIDKLKARVTKLEK